MLTEETEGFVISTIEYKEASKIVYLYTKDGKKSVMAKGASKYKNGLTAFTSTFNLVKYISTNSTFNVLKEYRVVNSYLNIKNDLKTTLYASSIFEIINQLKAETNHERIFEFVKRIMDKMENREDPFKLFVMSMVKFTYVFGVKPEFSSCLECGSTNIVNFSVKEGGALCALHAVKNESSLEDLNILKTLYYFDDSQSLDNISLDFMRAFKLIREYYSIHVPIKQKSLSTLIF